MLVCEVWTARVIRPRALEACCVYGAITNCALRYRWKWLRAAGMVMLVPNEGHQPILGRICEFLIKLISRKCGGRCPQVCTVVGLSGERVVASTECGTCRPACFNLSSKKQRKHNLLCPALVGGREKGKVPPLGDQNGITQPLPAVISGRNLQIYWSETGENHRRPPGFPKNPIIHIMFILKLNRRFLNLFTA